MLLKIDETCGVEGEIAVQGEMVEVPDPIGKSLVAMGRAHEATKAEIAAAKRAQATPEAAQAAPAQAAQ